MHRFSIGLSVSEFEKLTSIHEAILQQSICPTGFSGKRVVIVAPDGEIDGVEHGTCGVLEGALEDLNGRALAAVRLDDNGEMIYVAPGACVPAE